MQYDFYDMNREFLREQGIENPDDEDELLGIVESSKDDFLVWNTTTMLQIAGTGKSVNALKKCMLFPRTDVKSSSFTALSNILKETGQDFYSETLNNPKFPEKFTAILAIREYCDDRAAESVFARLKKILSRKRSRVYYSGDMSELLACLVYFSKYNTELTTKAFQIVKEKSEQLDQKERSWLSKNIPQVLE